MCTYACMCVCVCVYLYDTVPEYNSLVYIVVNKDKYIEFVVTNIGT